MNGYKGLRNEEVIKSRNKYGSNISNEFKKNTKIVPPGITRHKCAVCGKTEISDPNAEFRFCSKCNGNYEYCQDHLFTHQHIK